jgi:hypothetical protein
VGNVTRRERLSMEPLESGRGVSMVALKSGAVSGQRYETRTVVDGTAGKRKGSVDGTAEKRSG